MEEPEQTDVTEDQQEDEEEAAEAKRLLEEKAQKEDAQTERFEARNMKRREHELQKEQEKKTRQLIGNFKDKLERKLAQYAIGSKTREGEVIMEDSDEDRDETEQKDSAMPRELQSGYTSMFNFEHNKRTNDDKQEKAMKHFVQKGK